MASIRLQQLQKTYPNGEVAVRDIDLEVADGELMVLVGPSGCGKSTTLRMVAGLESPTDGRIYIGEEDVTGWPPQERDVAMVFQTYALYPHKTVRANLEFGLRMRGVGRATIDERVAEAARALGLGRVLDRKPAQLSGGQRQRVALGRAIVRHPKAFLLDEPLSNLDARLRVQTRAELARMHRELGATMLYVTHDQEEAMTLGDRIAVMREGRVQQTASPREVYRRPANAFVAGFIGSPAMNLFDCRVVGGEAGPTVSCDALGLALEPSDDPGVDGPVRLGIRPRDLVPAASADADVTARADVVELLGSDLLVHLRVGRGSKAPELRMVVPADAGVAVGDRVPLRFRRDRIHLFDSATGNRLA